MGFINRFLYSHNIWLFARKIFISFPFLYKVFLRKKNTKDFHEKLLFVRNQDHMVIEKNFYDSLEIFTNIFKNIKNNSNVFLIMDMPGAGEPAYFFQYLKNVFGYLLSKHCKIYIITNDSYKYVTRLYKKYFNVEYLFYDKKVSKNIYDFIKIKKGIIINSVWYPDTYNLFLKNPEKWSVYDSLGKVQKLMSRQLGKESNRIVPEDYEFIKKDLDEENLSKIIEFAGGNKIILCNFESKCGNMVNEYKIRFEDIIKKLSDIKNGNTKIFINSVYDGYTFKGAQNLMVAKLNFQEIIFLAEHDHIGKFISYRNGINDIFFNFYPSIEQIIYYPDEYIGNVSKTYYSKYIKDNTDLKCDWIHRRSLPERQNIHQFIKNDFLKTIEGFIC